MGERATMANWKSIVSIIGHIAASVVPGGSAVVDAVQENIDAKTGAEKEKAIIDSVFAGLNEVETFDASLIKDPTLFNKGITDAHAAFDEIKAALGK